MRLEEPAKLEQIQILSHEYKVEAALEFKRAFWAAAQLQY